MFPKEIQKRMMEEQDAANNGNAFLSQGNRLKTFLNHEPEVGHHIATARPIADLFPYTTVCFR